MEDKERALNHAIEQAQFSREKHQTYLKRTISKYTRVN